MIPDKCLIITAENKKLLLYVSHFSRIDSGLENGVSRLFFLLLEKSKSLSFFFSLIIILKKQQSISRIKKHQTDHTRKERNAYNNISNNSHRRNRNDQTATVRLPSCIHSIGGGK